MTLERINRAASAARVNEWEHEITFLDRRCEELRGTLDILCLRSERLTQAIKIERAQCKSKKGGK